MAQVDSENSTALPVPAERPAAPAGEIYIKTDISPEEAFREIGRLREEARREIDRLVNFLDETDNHMELEPEEDDDSEDEPSLGSLDRATDQTRWTGPTFVAREDLDRELDDADDKPLLGSVATQHHLSQDYWAQGNRDDREGDGCADDREEDTADDEPALGWPERMAQGAGGYGGWEDRELCVPTMTLEAWWRFRAQRDGGHRPNPDGRRDSHGR